MGDVVPISDALRAAREATLTRMLDAYNRGKLDDVVAAFAHPRLEVVPAGRIYDGPEQVRAHLEERQRSFPDQSFELVAVHHSDDVVLAEFWMGGTHLGEIHGVEPAGKRFRVRMASVFSFDGDQLTGQRLYFDTGTIARQLA